MTRQAHLLGERGINGISQDRDAGIAAICLIHVAVHCSVPLCNPDASSSLHVSSLISTSPL